MTRVNSHDITTSQQEARSEDRHLMRRMTRGEVELQQTKSQLRADQVERTRVRIQQLYDDDDRFGLQCADGDKHNGTSQKEESEINNDEIFAMPSTVQRKNITTRRSQSRARDSIGSTSIPLNDLLARRPHPRTKDTLYKQESNSPVLIAHEDENKRLFTTPKAKLDMPINKRTSNKAHQDFVFRMLPKSEDDPILYNRLKKLWMHKKSIEEDMQMALDDDDETRYRRLEDQHDAINVKMFKALRKSKAPNATSRSSDEDYDTPPEDEVENLSDCDSDDGSQADSNGSQADSNGNSNGIDWCYDGSSYLIYLKFPDETCVPWVVWTHMPVQVMVNQLIEKTSPWH
jgi:hypothetical protein